MLPSSISYYIKVVMIFGLLLSLIEVSAQESDEHKLQKIRRNVEKDKRFLKVEAAMVNVKVPDLEKAKAKALAKFSPPDKSFKWLGLQNNRQRSLEDLVKNKNFLIWISTASITRKHPFRAIYSTLLRNFFTADEVATLYDRLLQSNEESAAQLLQQGQFEYWRKKYKSPENVLTILRPIVYGESYLLLKPSFNQWIRYVETDFQSNHDEVIYLTLKSVYKDKNVVTIWTNALRAEETKSIAERLSRAQMEYWRKTYKSPEKLLEDLNLDLYIYNGFNDPAFGQWMVFVKDTVGTDYEKVIISALLKTFTDSHVARMCKEGLKDAQTKLMAEQLQKAQIEYWHKKYESPKELLHHIKENWVGLDDLLIHQWIRFVEATVATDKDEYIYLALREVRSDSVIASLCEYRYYDKSDSMTLALSERLQKAQIDYWRKEFTSAEELFQHKLNRWDLFKSPLFRQWVNFVKYTSARNQKDIIYSKLRDNYSDRDIAQICHDNLNDRRMKLTAIQVLQAQVEYWRTQYTSPDKLFKDLELEGSDLLHQPLFTQWVHFVRLTATNYHEVINSVLLKDLNLLPNRAARLED